MSANSTVTISVDTNHDAFWIARALEHYVATTCKEENLPFAAKRCSALAERYSALTRSYSSGWCAHDDCMKAIEEAAGLDRYTLPRL